MNSAMQTKETNLKKIWKLPELTLISQNHVTGGASNHYHENSISSSHTTNVGGYQFFFKFNGGGSGFGHHSKHFYYS